MINLSIFAATACSPKGSLFGFPTWYKYLPGQQVSDPISGNLTCTPKLDGINDIWLVVAAVVEILLRIAILAAITFVLIGGIKYMTSQGQSDQTESAKNTIVNALIGLVIAVAATAIVSFVAGRFS